MIYISLFNLFVIVRAAVGRLSRARGSLYGVLLGFLFVFSAFRYQVGCDWSGYFYQFYRQSFVGFEEAFAHREPLWWALMEVTQQLGLAYPWINVFSAGIFFVGVHVLARRQPDPLGFLVLLFPILIINLPMSGIRQGAAIGIICMAFVAFLDKRLVQFVGLTVLASTFHASAMIFLLLVPLVKGLYTRTRLVVSSILAIPGAVLLATSESGEIAVQRYVETGIDAAGSIFRLGILFLSGLFFFGFLRKPWMRQFPIDYRLASIGALIMLVLIGLQPISSVIGDRLGYYLIPIQAMIFARIPYLQIGSQTKLLSVVPYLGLVLVLVVWTSLSQHFELCYLPYQTWLFGFPNGTNFLLR